MHRLPSLSRRLGAATLVLSAASLLATAAAAAQSGGSQAGGGEVLPVQILHNLYDWCVDAAWWVIPMALIGGVIYHLCIPNRRDVPKAAMFLLTMALIIIPVALATPGVVSRLKSLGDSAWNGGGGGTSPVDERRGRGGGRGTP